MARRCVLIVGIVLIWTGAIIIPYGTYLQTLSPNFREYEQYVVKKVISENPGGHFGFSLALISAWPIAAVFCAAIGLLFVIGALALRFIAELNRDFMLMSSGIFISGCFLGSLLGIKEAIDSLRWGFIVLGIGYLLAAGGLFFGALGMLGCCRRWGCNRFRSLCSSGEYRIQLQR